MSILCDLFVADPADAPHYADDSDGHEWTSEMESASLGGLTQLPFEILWAIVEGRPWQADAHAFEWVGEPPEEDASTWLFRFPAPFVTRLASLTPTEAAAITREWAKTEEVASSPDEIAPVVTTLLELARSAEASKRGLFLWGSL